MGSGRFTFCDCSIESPTGRRSVCYDHEALVARKEHRPKSSAVEMAAAMGIELLQEGGAPMKQNKKVVLLSKSGYDKRHDPMLIEFIDLGIELFCAVGKDAEAWEEAVDWLCIGPDGTGERFVNTASSEGWTLEDALQVAEQWHVKSGSNGVTVIEI
jgi:hypothetical protein